MKIFTGLLSIVVVLRPVVADFQLFYVWWEGLGLSYHGWSVFNERPDCNFIGVKKPFKYLEMLQLMSRQYEKPIIWPLEGQKREYFVLCEGPGCQENPGPIDMVQMRFGPGYHWSKSLSSAACVSRCIANNSLLAVVTFEANDYDMFASNGRVVGGCDWESGGEFRCPMEVGDFYGTRKLRCDIKGIDAEGVNAFFEWPVYEDATGWTEEDLRNFTASDVQDLKQDDVVGLMKVLFKPGRISEVWSPSPTDLGKPGSSSNKRKSKDGSN